MVKVSSLFCSPLSSPTSSRWKPPPLRSPRVLNVDQTKPREPQLTQGSVVLATNRANYSFTSFFTGCYFTTRAIFFFLFFFSHPCGVRFLSTCQSVCEAVRSLKNRSPKTLFGFKCLPNKWNAVAPTHSCWIKKKRESARFCCRALISLPYP